MTRIVCVMMAIASALAMPVLALAQVGSQSSALSVPAAPAETSTAEQRALVSTKVVRLSPSKPIGLVDHEAYLSPVALSDLDQLRSDLISFSNFMAELSPVAQERMRVGNFDEDRIQALTDDQLTVMYNVIPDMASFHLAVASLRQASRQAAARQAAVVNAAKVKAAAANGQSGSGSDGQPQTDQPDRLAPAMGLDGTPLSSPLTVPVFFTGGCPGTYYDAETIYAFHVVRNALAIAEVIAQSLVSAAEFQIFGAGTNAALVVVWAVLKIALDAANFGLDMVEFCDGTVRDMYTDTAYDNLIAIHANLSEHDMIEKDFLKEFRNLYIRKEIEKNLLSTADLRISLFQLPEPAMMVPHEGVGINKVKDIVLDTIQRNQLAGMPIGNAQTLYNDGLTLLAQNRYKDAYARFRSAYQAAVNQTVR